MRPAPALLGLHVLLEVAALAAPGSWGWATHGGTVRWRRAVEALRGAFPALRVTLEEVLAGGERGATRHTVGARTWGPGSGSRLPGGRWRSPAWRSSGSAPG